MNYKKEKKTEDIKLNKKALNCIKTNFPDYNKLSVIKDTNEKVIALLDYGKSEPKLKVEIARTEDSYNFYKLMDFQFVY